MSRSLSKGATPCRFEDHPTEPVTPVHNPIAVVAIARNRWSSSIGTTGRHQSEQVVAITRCAHLVEAIVASRISPRFIHLYGTEPVDAIAAHTREIVKAINSRVEEGFPLMQAALKELRKSMDEAFDKERQNLRKELRYLGFGLLGAIVVVSIYFGLR
jgi:hypothetical protein